MSKNATLIVTPTLKVNSNDCDLNLLRNFQVKVTMISFIDDLPMTKTFENLELKKEKGIVVTFQVTPNLESVSVTVSDDVKNITKGISERKTHSTNFSVSTYRNTTRYFETYLTRNTISIFTVRVVNQSLMLMLIRSL